MNPIFAVVMICCVAAIQAQPVPGAYPPMPPAAAAPGMPQANPFNTQNLYLSSLYGINIFKLQMAEHTARLLGNTPQARLYAGRIYDMPDNWWITSSAFNGQLPPAFAAFSAMD